MIEKEIILEGRKAKLRSSALIPKLYRAYFGHDMIKDMKQLAKSYKALKDLAKKSGEALNTLATILEGLPTDCSICALKGICDEVEGMKELHFGVGAGGAEKGHGH